MNMAQEETAGLDRVTGAPCALPVVLDRAAFAALIVGLSLVTFSFDLDLQKAGLMKGLFGNLSFLLAFWLAGLSAMARGSVSLPRSRVYPLIGLYALAMHLSFAGNHWLRRDLYGPFAAGEAARFGGQVLALAGAVLILNSRTRLRLLAAWTSLLLVASGMYAGMQYLHIKLGGLSPPARSWGFLASVVLLAPAFCYSAVKAKRNPAWATACGALTAATACVLTYAVLFLIRVDRDTVLATITWTGARSPSFFLNPNFYGGFAVGSMGLTLGLCLSVVEGRTGGDSGLSRGDRFALGLSVPALGINLLGLYCSKSLASFLGMAVVLVLTALFVVCRQRAGRRTDAGKHVLHLLAVWGAALVCLGVSHPRAGAKPNGPVVKASATAEGAAVQGQPAEAPSGSNVGSASTGPAGAEESSLVRFLAGLGQSKAVRARVLWPGSWRLARDHLLLGCGPGQFVAKYPRGRRRDYRRFTPGGGVENTTHAHCEGLQVLAELGIVGALCYFGIFLIAAWELLPLLRRRGDAVGMLALGAAAGMLGLLLNAQGSVNVRWYACGALLWLGLGFVLAARSFASPGGGRMVVRLPERMSRPSSLFAATLVGAAVWASSLVGLLNSREASLHLETAEDILGALDDLRAGREKLDRATETALLQEALDAASRSLAAHPHSLHALNYKGRTLVLLERYDEALVPLSRLAAICPAWSNASEKVGRIHLLKADLTRAPDQRMGHIRRAAEALAQAWRFDCHPEIEVEYFNAEGRRRVSEQRWREASDCYERVLRADPNAESALYFGSIALEHVADELENQGQATLARDARRRALERARTLHRLNPTDEDLRGLINRLDGRLRAAPR